VENLPADLAVRLCESASIGIVLTDGDFAVRMINASAGRLLGVSPADAVGKAVDELLPERRRAMTRRLLLRAKDRLRPVELRMVYPRGPAKRHLAIVVDPVRDESGQVQGLCLWIRDQTRRMELERRLARIDKLASLGQMAAGLAHHLNNVLGGIVTAVDHGLSADDLAGSRRALTLISQGVTSAVQLCRRLLEFSSPELPPQNIVDLTEAVITFTEQVQDRVRAAGRQIDLDVKAVPVLAVDQFKLQQILEILLANAEQALGPRGGRIGIRLDADDGVVRLYFHDSGPGIPDDMVERVFEPFFTTRGAFGGGSEGNLGLGLTLARRLAGEIGASLTFSREHSREGACFLIEFLPRRNEPSPPGGQESG
jgi:PAS domain S-box-containing protein